MSIHTLIFTVTRVFNLQGPQTQVSQSDPVLAIKKEPMEDPGFSGGIEERLQNIETHLKLDKREFLGSNTK